MSEDREKALEQALQAVLAAARFQQVDLDVLCRQAAESLNSSVGAGWHKTMGIDLVVAEIEKAKASIAIGK